MNALEAEKDQVQAYIFFDFFVTDKKGNAIRNFKLDSSLHVLWKIEQRNPDIPLSDIQEISVDASNPEYYAKPKKVPQNVRIWAERELVRYHHKNEIIKLPKGVYQGKIILTEESFHAYGGDAGYWATVLKSDIQFEITD